MLLIATTQDENSCVVSIAFTIVKGEMLSFLAIVLGQHPSPCDSKVRDVSNFRRLSKY
ncbi:hypothetical protein CR513_37565, partial [Mucuna pruriens]